MGRKVETTIVYGDSFVTLYLPGFNRELGNILCRGLQGWRWFLGLAVSLV